MNDQIQPHSEDIEKALLGAILVYPQSFPEVSQILSESAFYSKQNALIYKSIRHLVIDGKPIDSLLLLETIKSKDFEQKKNLALYLCQLETNAPPPSAISEYTKILYQSHIRRTVIENCFKNIALAQNPDSDEFELIESASRPILKLHEHLLTAGQPDIKTTAKEYQEEIMRMIESGGGISGIRSFIPLLDNRLGGLGNGRMISVAGRPGSGKTAFAVQVIVNVCLKNNKHPLVVYTLEMTRHEMMNRIVSCILKYPYSRIAKGDVEVSYQDNWLKCIKYISESNLQIIDNMNSLQDIAADMKSRTEKFGIKCAIIDYVQLIKNKSERKSDNREQEVGSVSRGIKQLAKELSIPILALVQLNRESEKRATKKPILTDLRESGSLEMDSDSVTFVYRPFFASGGGMDSNGEKISETEAWLLTVKNRHGAVGEDECFCDIACNVFRDVEQLERRYVDYTESNKGDESTPF